MQLSTHGKDRPRPLPRVRTARRTAAPTKPVPADSWPAWTDRFFVTVGSPDSTPEDVRWWTND